MQLVKYLTPFIFLFITHTVEAQRWSYVYIQGDKQTPFYVKLEGEMLPRYSKNYCIIPQLGKGAIRLQILFQQNQYPPQNYTVLVPESGARAFLLTKKENGFALYDLDQHFYLYPGDKNGDRLPEKFPGHAQEKVSNISEEPAPQKKEADKIVDKKQNKTVEKKKGGQPQFIENIVLKNDRNKTAVAQEDIETETVMQNVSAQRGNFESDKTPILNSDCPQPMNGEDFGNLFSASRDKTDDEKRLHFLIKKAETSCFTARQAYLLARQMKAESMRYTFLKKTYSRITDQQNFSLLEDYLFKTPEWKNYFRLIFK